MPQNYVVKSGDTLSGIASKYGVNYNTITGYSSGNPNLIRPGEVLNIPDKVAATPTPSSTPAPAPTPSYSAPAPTPSYSSPAPANGTTPEGVPLGSLPPDLLYNGGLDISNPVKQAKYSQIVDQYRQNNGSIPSTTTGFNQPTIDLPSIYNKLYDSSGIKAKQDQLAGFEKDYTEAIGQINDNPFLSEATRVGKIAKIEELFQNRTANLKNDIATSKADVETQLNLQTKQFDIRSQQAQQALSQFNNLLSIGALDNVSGAELANVTSATGLPSAFIQSAVNAAKKKNMNTSIVQVDDGTQVSAVLLNNDTGEVLNKTVLSASKPAATKAPSATEKASANLSAGNFNNNQITKAINILAKADTLYNANDKGDKLLSAAEQQQALLKIQAEVVADPTLAFQLLQLAAEQGGFGDWNG